MKRCITPLLAVAVIGCRVPEGSLAPAQTTATAARAIGLAASTNLFAVVDTHGALVAGRGVTSVTPLGAGAVEVTFTQPVAPCAYVATPTNAYADAIIVSTSGATSPNGIVVTSRTQTGIPIAGAFHLLVSCTAVMPFAVVDVNGQVARSSGGVTIAVAGTGVYRVTFPQNIASCSYLASLGDAGQVTVPSVGGVYTASYVGVNTVRVETRNASGVSQGGLPFHLVTLCGTAPNTAYAVLSAGGLIVRGSPAGAGTVTHSATGLYTVNSTGNTSGCAKLVTRGSSGRGIPSTAATVEIGAGSSARLFTVEVRALLAQGGVFTDQDFHLGVVC
ncbi:MAG: hypothetical protein U0132_09790 [Gemmatimonadaceae bacterium]